MSLFRNIVLIGIVFCLPLFAYAETSKQPKISIEPKKNGPGDIAIIRVENAEAPVEGNFSNKVLYFNAVPASPKTFEAILGLDLNIEPGKYDLDILAGKSRLHQSVKISKKLYPLQRLTLPKGMVELSPENEARAERDQKKTAAIWPVDSPRFWTGNFIDPLPGKKINGKFGLRRIINNIPKASHSGVDVTADEGTPVLAPNDGVVVLSEDQFFSGNSIILDHGQGIYTMFFHLSRANVRYGQAVRKGEVIGLVGQTGRASGPHLHWGARIQGARVDPVELINLKLE